MFLALFRFVTAMLRAIVVSVYIFLSCLNPPNDYGCVFHRILEWVVFSERHSDASRCSESAFDFWSGAGTDFPVSSPRRQRLVLPGFSLV